VYFGWEDVADDLVGSGAGVGGGRLEAQLLGAGEEIKPARATRRVRVIEV
jgi:hypothetical protein